MNVKISILALLLCAISSMCNCFCQSNNISKCRINLCTIEYYHQDSSYFAISYFVENDTTFYNADLINFAGINCFDKNYNSNLKDKDAKASFLMQTNLLEIEKSNRQFAIQLSFNDSAIKRRIVLNWIPLEVRGFKVVCHTNLNPFPNLLKDSIALYFSDYRMLRKRKRDRPQIIKDYLDKNSNNLIAFFESGNFTFYPMLTLPSNK